MYLSMRLLVDIIVLINYIEPCPSGRIYSTVGWLNDYYKIDPNIFNYLPKVDEKVDYEYLTNTKTDV